MKRENLIAFLKAHGAEIRGYGVKSLALFGSVARDVVSKKMLKPQIRDAVETEAIYVS